MAHARGAKVLGVKPSRFPDPWAWLGVQDEPAGTAKPSECTQAPDSSPPPPWRAVLTPRASSSARLPGAGTVSLL